MKRVIVIFQILLLVLPVFAYEYPPVPATGTFHMTVNSIKDDQFKIDKYGVNILNSELIVTFHLNPDSINAIYDEDLYHLFVFRKDACIENYGDSVKFRYMKGYSFYLDDVLKIYVHYGDPHDWGKGVYLAANEIKIVDCIKNLECLDAYKRTTSIVGVDNDENNRKKKRQNNLYFDLNGRRLSSPPSKGIYIQNGKKVVK